MTSTVLSELRSATGTLHARLDRGVSPRLVMASRASYATFLRASLAAVEALTLLHGSSEVDERAAAIRADLAALGEEVETALSVRVMTPQETDEARTLGIAYVLEGSTLGGLVLAKWADEKLSLDGTATRYLRLRGQDTGPMWAAFLERLVAWGERASSAERALACEAAVSTFGVYLDAFQRAGLVSDAA